MRVRIADIAVPPGRRALGDIQQLSASIREVGLLNPITVTENRVLVAGRHRLEACRSLGWEEIPATVVSLSAVDAELAEIDENLIRNELSTLEEAEQLRRRKELYEAKYPETKQGTAGAAATNEKRWGAVANETVSFATDTASKTSKSERSVQQKVQIAERIPEDVKDLIRDTPAANSTTDLLTLARLEPEQQRQAAAKLASGEVLTLRKAARQARREEYEQSIADAPLPERKYRVLYADPPWSYGNSGLDEYGHAERHYATLSLDELCELPVAGLSQPDAVLFLWVTSPLLEGAFRVLRAWGFQYKSSFVWDKVRHNFGYYNSVRHELLLVATRGSCTPDVNTLFDSVVEIERSERHSEKPARFREIIDTLYPHGARVELFARTSVDGWDTWGNELSHERIA